jgi:tripartite-type tricarboxylate transporter receptor subunit TctC
MKNIFLSTLLGASALALMSTGAVAAPADTFKDKTVTILVGYGAGGTYGRTSLLLGNYMGGSIPGNPNVVVQHMPGAGGIKATNYFYNVAPKNGLNLLMPPEMTIVSQLLRPKKIKYDAKKFTWLGRVFGQNTTLVIRRDSGVTTLKGTMSKQIIVASSGKGSPTYLVPAMLNALLGTKLKIVTGYRGSRKMQLAMEQGEAQGVALGWVAWDSAKADWFKGGDKSYAIALVQSGFGPQKGIENVPMVSSFLNNDDDKKVAKMLASAAIIGRGLVLPPGASKDVIAPLRAAFDNVTKRKDFRADALKRGLLVNPLTGAEIQTVVNELLSMPQSTVARAQKIIFGKKK